MNLIYQYTDESGDVFYLTESGATSRNPVLARVFNDAEKINVNIPDINGATGMFVAEPQTYPADTVSAALADVVEAALKSDRPRSQRRG